MTCLDANVGLQLELARARATKGGEKLVGSMSGLAVSSGQVSEDRSTSTRKHLKPVQTAGSNVDNGAFAGVFQGWLWAGGQTTTPPGATPAKVNGSLSKGNDAATQGNTGLGNTGLAAQPGGQKNNSSLMASTAAQVPWMKTQVPSESVSPVAQVSKSAPGVKSQPAAATGSGRTSIDTVDSKTLQQAVNSLELTTSTSVNPKPVMSQGRSLAGARGNFASQSPVAANSSTQSIKNVSTLSGKLMTTSGARTSLAINVASAWALGGQATDKPSNNRVTMPHSSSNSLNPNMASLQVPISAQVQPASVDGANPNLVFKQSNAEQPLGQWIVQQATVGPQQMQVRVVPEGLGSIVISVTHQANGINVQVEASAMQTVQWLQQVSSQVIDAVKSTGLNVTGFGVSFGQANLTHEQNGRQAPRKDSPSFRSRGASVGGVAAVTMASRDGPVDQVLDPSTHRISVRV